jgi:hypothetical protein
MMGYFALVENWIGVSNEMLSLIVLVSILGALVIGLRFLNKWKLVRFHRERASNMDPIARESYCKREIADKIVDDILELQIEGKMTRDEAAMWTSRLANMFGIEDLLPRQRKLVKKAIKDRLKSYRKLGAVNPNIPGDKPPQKVEPNKYEEKNNVVPLVAKTSFMKAFMERVRKAS